MQSWWTKFFQKYLIILTEYLNGSILYNDINNILAFILERKWLNKQQV